MFKILLVERTSPKLLLTPYMITTLIDGVDTRVEFETDDETVLEDTVEKLMEVIPRKQIMTVDNIDYEVDVRLRGRGVLI